MTPHNSLPLHCQQNCLWASSNFSSRPCVCACVFAILTAATRALEVEASPRPSAEMQRSDVMETLTPPTARRSRGPPTLHMPILRHFLQFRPADLLLYETLVALGGPCTRKWALIRSLLSLSVLLQEQDRVRISLFPLYVKDPLNQIMNKDKNISQRMCCWKVRYDEENV